MKDIGIAQGSAAQAIPLIVGVDTVYVHTNIVQVMDSNGVVIDNFFSYNEVQYDKDEYIAMIGEKNALLEQQMTDAQLALCALYERVIV